MGRAAEIVEWLQLVGWTSLAIAALNLWRRRRTGPSTWLALTFGALAVVVIGGRLLPDVAAEPTFPLRVLLAVLVLFPYLLYRFVASMVERSRWEWVLAHVLTAAAVVDVSAVPAFPEAGEPRSVAFVVFLVVFLVQWTFLLSRAAWQLWRAGSAQPAVARKRMRLMSVAASMLALTLVLSATGPSSGTSSADLAVDIIGLLVAPLFFIAFHPPRTLRLVWRQREEADLRATEIGLVRAVSRTEVAAAWLPRVSDLVGGRGAIVFDMDRSVLALHNISPAEVAHMSAGLEDGMPRYTAVEVGSHRVVAMHNGWLVVGIGPLTPFFGDDELRTVGASSVVADLALGRARLFELERQARAAMGDFVAIASHDLRTPVTVISGFTELMRSQWDAHDDAEKQDFLDAIARQVHHLDRLIGDLLTVTKLDVSEIDVFPRAVDVERTAREVAAELEIDADIRTEALTSGVRVFADPDHVARMLRNYLSNAVTYGGPPIVVDISGRNGSVVVCVRDTGPGVPEEFRSRLFEKFARADKKKSRSVGGTGLGLSIVRGLAERNRGDAWYEPERPTGSRFCFRLPVASSTDEA